MPRESRTRKGRILVGEAGEPACLDQEATAAPRVRTLDPMTGRQISPVTDAALCVSEGADRGHAAVSATSPDDGESA